MLKHLTLDDQVVAPVAPFPAMEERRRSQRVGMAFPVTVRGVDALGTPFTLHTVLDNMSACGLYLRLPRPVVPGIRLFAVVRICMFSDTINAPSVAVSGLVLRTEIHSDDTYGIALHFDRHRFLYATS